MSAASSYYEILVYTIMLTDNSHRRISISYPFDRLYIHEKRYTKYAKYTDILDAVNAETLLCYPSPPLVVNVFAMLPFCDVSVNLLTILKMTRKNQI